MSTLSTHVLDTSRGAPAAGVLVRLTALDGEGGPIEAVTDDDGRIAAAAFGEDLEIGLYELRFIVAPYFARAHLDAFYEEILVRFRIDAEERHYHVPLLLSPWGYTTYRGS